MEHGADDVSRRWVEVAAVYTVRFITRVERKPIESRRGLALDWGFLPGAEDDSKHCTLAMRMAFAHLGLDRLSVFTS